MPNLLALIAVVLIAPSTQGEDVKTERRTIAVTGTGRISAPPNVADISVGVVTQAKTAREALSANNESMAALHKVLKERGVAAKDIQTAYLNVSPQYSQPPPHNPNNPLGQFVPQIVGYNVTNTVQVTARDLAKLGELLDAVITAGANQLNGISFRIDGAESLLDNARKKAMADAKKKADLMAGEAGVVVGPPVSIRDEQTPVQPIFQPMMQTMGMFAAPAAPSLPVASGEQELSVTVYIVYELKLPK
jgi:uncharacterized protein YggE